MDEKFAKEPEVVVKFHLRREVQTWLGDDLESYLDGLLLAESGRQTFVAELENLSDF